MKTKLLTLLLLVAAFALSGCAVMESPTTFGVCKAADVATTAYALNTGLFHESNPILKPFIGPHHIMPLIAVSLLMWWVIYELNEPKVTVVANGITCGVAAHNLLLIH